ncbi:unnamed protein product [Vicia faba]|uniref:AP2/ERF domain-containing protein n=1 Tax=Vicia faba TaxID=3906 RepID=A0AAV0ZJ15_VICFA|nr:unnamed protein product [Vicia faba]
MNKRKDGRKKFHETRHPIYKGVRQRNGKWVCELRQPNTKTRRVWLGTFSHPDMAAKAYDVAALAFRGEAASLNFPNSASSLPRLSAQTSSIRSIQFAATKAAEKHFSSREGYEPFFTAETVKNDSESLNCVSDVNVCMGEDSGRLFWDEEEVFNMPGLINSMAEGLIITPPALQRGFNWVDGETTVDLTLWKS